MLTLKHDGIDFVLPHELLAKFCRVVEFTNKKNDYIYLCSDGDAFTMFSQSTIASVMVSAKLPVGKQFWLGVSSSKFCALAKKLYEGSEIWCRPKPKSLIVEEDNLSVKLSVVDYVKQYTVPQCIALGGDLVGVLADSIWRCEAAVSTKKLFESIGVLLDNTHPSLTRVVKFGTASGFRIINHPKIFEGSGRFVIPPGATAALHAFRDEVEGILLSDRHFGMQITGGVYAYTPLLIDEYPQEYVRMLGLRDELQQMEEGSPRYILDREPLLNALDLMATVSGRDETQVAWDLVGAKDGTSNPVWRLTAKSVDGCEASELVGCLGAGQLESNSFKVHRANMAAVLRESDDRVALHNVNDRNVAVTNLQCTDVTLLPKFG